MISLLTTLIGSKYGKIGIEIGVLAVLAFGVRWYYLSEGKRQQKESDAQKQEQAIESSRKVAEQAKDSAVQQANENERKADQRAQAAQQQFTVLAQALHGLAAQRTSNSERLAAIPDTGLRNDIIRQLAARPANDLSACYTPSEERLIDEAVTNYPVCKKQVEALQQQVSASQDKVQALKDGQSDLSRKVDALLSYQAELEKSYNQVFDLHPPRYRAGKCVWLWKCGTKKTSIGQQPGP